MSGFDFGYDPSLFPTPPPLPPSADLFSQGETSDLLGFLDNFGSYTWDDSPSYHDAPQDLYLPAGTPYNNPHLGTIPERSSSLKPRRSARNASRAQIHSAQDMRRSLSNTPPAYVPISHSHQNMSHPPPSASSASSAAAASAADNSRSRPLLSTPQKRLNHIMSEQKRRNAIRDGYAQLIALLAPAGGGAPLNMPSRGRPKGSGARNNGSKGPTKGKSGVLFRAVEYVRWLEEGRNALRAEVQRMEAAAALVD